MALAYPSRPASVNGLFHMYNITWPGALDRLGPIDTPMHMSAIRRSIRGWVALCFLAALVSACTGAGTSPAVKGDATVPETFRSRKPPEKPPVETKSDAERAREHLKAGEYAKARKAASEAIAHKDRSADSVIATLDKEADKERGQGARAFKSGDLKSSISHWERALEMNPGAPDTKKLKEDLAHTRELFSAREAYKAGYYGKAFREASKAQDYELTRGGALELIKKLRAMADEQYRKGLKHYIAERMDQAIAEWERALVIYPGHERSVRDLKDARRLQQKMETVR